LTSRCSQKRAFQQAKKLFRRHDSLAMRAIDRCESDTEADLRHPHRSGLQAEWIGLMQWEGQAPDGPRSDMAMMNLAGTMRMVSIALNLWLFPMIGPACDVLCGEFLEQGGAFLPSRQACLRSTIRARFQCRSELASTERRLECAAFSCKTTGLAWRNQFVERKWFEGPL